jgi:hypothetical protein
MICGRSSCAQTTELHEKIPASNATSKK